MLLSPHARSRCAAALRLLAAWLAVVWVMQAFQGALILGAGPLHRHDTVMEAAGDVRHVHFGFERHHHPKADLGLHQATAAEGDADTISLAQALLAAMGLMALGRATGPLLQQRHVLRAVGAWSWRCRVTAPLLRPPRLPA